MYKMRIPDALSCIPILHTMLSYMSQHGGLSRERGGQEAYRYRYRQDNGYRYRMRDQEPQFVLQRRSTEDMGSTTRINAHGVELGSDQKDAFDAGKFGGFGGYEGSILGTSPDVPKDGNPLQIIELDQTLQHNAYKLIAQALREASLLRTDENTVYLPLSQPDITYNFPAQFDSSANKLRTIYPTLHLRTISGEKLAIRIGYLSGQYRDGVKVKRRLFIDHTQKIQQAGSDEPLPPYGLNVARKVDEVGELSQTYELPDVEFVQKRFGMRRVTERVYRSPEGIQAFLESKGLTGKAILAPLLFTLLRSGFLLSDDIVRQAEKIGAVSLGVVRSNVLFVPYDGKVFSVITDKTSLLDERDVAKIEAFLHASVKNGLFHNAGRAIEFVVRDIAKERFFVEYDNKKIGITWKDNSQQ